MIRAGSCILASEALRTFPSDHFSEHRDTVAIPQLIYRTSGGATMTDFGRALRALENNPLGAVSSLGVDLWKEMEKHPVESIVGVSLLAGAGGVFIGKKLVGGTAADLADEALAKSVATSGETLEKATAAVSGDARETLLSDLRQTRISTPATAHPASAEAIGVRTGDPSIARPGEW